MSRPWRFLLLAGLIGAICIRLGIWQLERHALRAQRNDAIQAALAQPPLLLPEQGPVGEGHSYRRVRAVGRFDPAQQVLLMNRAHLEQPGYHLVTPLRFADGSPSMLVDRGWIPQEAGSLQRLQEYAVEGQISLSGRLMPSQPQPAWSILADPTPSTGERRLGWRALSVPLIQRQVPYPLAALYLQQSEPLGEADAAPVPTAELELSAGPHLGYALQWFAFAAIALGGAAIWARRQS